MDAPTRPPTDALSREAQELFKALAERPHAFQLFAALRLVEAAHPQKPRLGRSARIVDDPLRLGQTPAMDFAPRDIHSLRHRAERPPLMLSYYPGLWGPHGALPLHLTEYAFERELHFHDQTFARFADLFHHRILSLFYRAWADAQPTVQFDRPEEDRFTLYTGALAGIGQKKLHERDSVPDRFKRFFAGRLVPAAKNAEGLRNMVEAWFRVPAKLQEFVPGWMRLPIESCTRLGESRATGELGVSALLGSSIWGGQHRFRLRLGPLRLSQFKHLLPGRQSSEQLMALVRGYVNHEFAWDAQLVLRREEVPGTQLGSGAQLGWSTWMTPKTLKADADDLVLALGD